MLALDRPLGVVAGLALYGDHADASRVYYLPTRPRVARVGNMAELSFVKFRGDDPLADGGAGLLSFTTELVATDEALDEARRHVARLGVAEPVLARLDVRAGKAVLAAALQEGDGFVERMLGEATPDLAGSCRAVFSLHVNQAGARLVEAMLEAEGPRALGVRYELEYLGLRPALRVRLRADYGRIYDELSFGFQAGVAYQGVGVRVGVESATKKLVENGAIEVEVLHFTDDADLRARVDEAVRWFQDELLEEFFETKLVSQGRESLIDKAIAAAAQLGTTLAGAMASSVLAAKLAELLGVSPELLRALQGAASGGQAGGAPGGGQGGAQSTFSAKLEFSLRDVHESERRVMELDWSEARAEKRTAAPQGLLAEIGPRPSIVEADARGDLWRTLAVNVRPLGDFRALGVERLVVQLAHPGEDDPRATTAAFTFEPERQEPQRFAAWTDGKPPRYRFQVETHFAEEGAWPGPPAFTGPWKTSQALELAVHPLTDVPRVELELSPGTVDLTETPQVQVDVRIDGEGVATRMLTAASPTAVVRQRISPRPAPLPEEALAAPAGPLVEARTTWFHEGGSRTEGEWAPVEGSVLLVHAPWRSRRTVRVLPLLPPDFIDASVTLTLTEGRQSRVVDVQLLPSDRGAKVVSLPSLAEQPPPVRVDVLVIRGDGSTFVGTPFETSEPVVLVRDRDGEHRKLDVRLLAGARLSDHGLIAVQVQLLDEAEAPLDSVVFTESQRGPGLLLVPVAGDGTVTVRYRVTRYGLDGRPHAGAVLEGAPPQLLVPAVAP